jgi:hypothetical protein
MGMVLKTLSCFLGVLSYLEKGVLEALSYMCFDLFGMWVKGASREKLGLPPEMKLF